MSADKAYEKWLQTPREPDYGAFLDGYEAGVKAAAEIATVSYDDNWEIRQEILALLDKP